MVSIGVRTHALKEGLTLGDVRMLSALSLARMHPLVPSCHAPYWPWQVLDPERDDLPASGTKVVATLGPACHDVGTLVDLLNAGVVGACPPCAAAVLTQPWQPCCTAHARRTRGPYLGPAVLPHLHPEVNEACVSEAVPTKLTADVRALPGTCKQLSRRHGSCAASLWTPWAVN